MIRDIFKGIDAVLRIFAWVFFILVLIAAATGNIHHIDDCKRQIIIKY